MKTIYYILYWAIILIVIGCKNPESKKIDAAQKSKKQSNSIQRELKSNEIKSDSSTTFGSEDKTRQKRPEFYYVSAKSGLKFRKSPKGEVLGSFPLNSRLLVINHTKLYDQIVDGQETHKAEWVGVEKDKDTVFVFSAYLSSNPIYSALKIFFASPCYQKDGENRKGFISLTGAYWPWGENEEEIIPTEKIGRDNIELSKRQKSEFLKKLGINDSDKAFIYNLELDSIFVFPIERLALVASINAYAVNNENLSEQDYEIGLGLGKNYCARGDNFTYLGKENIFQKRKLKIIAWEKIDNLQTWIGRTK